MTPGALRTLTMAKNFYGALVAGASVTVVVQPADAPYSYAEIRGTAEMITEGAPELIDELSVKYTGKHYAEFNPASANDADRVIVSIKPRKVVGSL